MTNLRQAAQAVVERWDTPAWEWRDQGPTADLMADLRTALAQPVQEPTQWRDMVVVTLVREGINKHRARELADHFATPPANRHLEFARAIIEAAQLKERNRGATTHCQCAACKNGNIHDSDCSVHNGDALPVGPCDCSLATPPVQPAEPAQTFYQPAENEAVEILKSLGYVYEPTYTGLAWVAKKSAQPEQESVAYDKTEINCFVQDLYDEKMQEGKHGHYEALFYCVHQAIKRAAHGIKEGT